MFAKAPGIIGMSAGDVNEKTVRKTVRLTRRGLSVICWLEASP
jgi:hypothetical protein